MPDISGRRKSSDLELILGYVVTFNFRHGCAVFARVGECVRLRHDLYSQRGHEGAAGGCGGPKTGGDQLLPHQGESNNEYFCSSLARNDPSMPEHLLLDGIIGVSCPSCFVILIQTEIFVHCWIISTDLRG